VTTYAGAADVIPGDLDGVDRATGTISMAADGAASRSAELRTAVDSTEDFWASPSGTAYRIAARKQIRTTGMLVGPLDTASRAFGTLARELRGARSTVDRALAGSVALGMGPSDLVSNPWAVTSFLLANPQHAPTVAGLLGDVAGARISAGAAHTAFVAALTGVRDGLDGADERLLGSRRGPDERVTIVIVAVVTVLAGCTALFGGDRGAEQRFARPGQPQTSPSGTFVAQADLGPEPNGVQTWVVVITERDGREVFRDSEAYSSRHGVGITWRAGTDELWVLSSDVGTSSVRRGADGNWSKEYPRPGHYEQDVPAEIRELAGR